MVEDRVKGPACRQADETRSECVDRKIDELIEIDGMEPDQAVAVANKLCDKACSTKGLNVNDFVRWRTLNGGKVGRVLGFQKAPPLEEDAPFKLHVQIYSWTLPNGKLIETDRLVLLTQGQVTKIARPRIKELGCSPTIHRRLTDLCRRHNLKWGFDGRRRTNTKSLIRVFNRGEKDAGMKGFEGKSAEAFAVSRVKSFLLACETLIFNGRTHDADLLPEMHPLHGFTKADIEKTNFPKFGDDERIALVRSKYHSFPAIEADKLPTTNYLDDFMFGELKDEDEYAIRVREEQADEIRNLADSYEAAIKQAKWLLIGEGGIENQRALIAAGPQNDFESPGDDSLA